MTGPSCGVHESFKGSFGVGTLNHKPGESWKGFPPPLGLNPNV